MRQYFEAQKDLGVATYYLRVFDSKFAQPSVLYARHTSLCDTDILASELRFIEYVHDPRLGYSIPIFEKQHEQ